MPYLVLDPVAAEAAPLVSYGAPEAASAHPFGKSLLSMRTRLKLELGNRTDIPDEIWNDWINDAYQDIHESLNLPESNRSFGFDAVADSQMYRLPATVDTIRSVVIRDTVTVLGRSLEKSDSSTYRKLPAVCGAPETWFREQNILVLWPTPDKAYTVTVDAILKPQKLIADTDYPLLEDKWHEIILKSAKARAWEGVQNDTKSALVENSVARQVQRKNDREQRESENEYPRMRVVRCAADIMDLTPSRRTHGDRG